MPEGPEIRRAADRIARVLVGETLEEASFAFDHLQRYSDILPGSTVTAVETRGKAMLTRFDNRLTLYSHNQLYGRWYTSRRGSLPDTRRSLRVALHTATHSALLYSASEVDVLSPEDVEAHPFLARIGPDILAADLDAAVLEARLVDAKFRGRSLAALYLDQGFLAGLGNYLRTEILHLAGIHPARRPKELTPEELSRLAMETLAVSRRSYRTGGVTLTDAKARTLGANGSSRPRHRFWAFSRAGKPCYACRSKLVRDNFSGRRLYFCPRCQPSGVDGKVRRRDRTKAAS